MSEAGRNGDTKCPKFDYSEARRRARNDGRFFIEQTSANEFVFKPAGLNIEYRIDTSSDICHVTEMPNFKTFCLDKLQSLEEENRDIKREMASYCHHQLKKVGKNEGLIEEMKQVIIGPERQNTSNSGENPNVPPNTSESKENPNVTSNSSESKENSNVPSNPSNSGENLNVPSNTSEVGENPNVSVKEDDYVDVDMSGIKFLQGLEVKLERISVPDESNVSDGATRRKKKVVKKVCGDSLRRSGRVRTKTAKLNL